MKKILITGGSGFIGSEIVRQLSRTNAWDITVLDAMTEQIHGAEWEKSYLYSSIRDQCNFIYGDIRNLKSVEKAVKDQEYIVHLAAETGTGQSMYDINHYNDVNIMGTSNLFQALSLLGPKRKIKKMILGSSRSVYGEGKYRCPNCGCLYPSARDKEAMVKGDFHMYCEHCHSVLEVAPTTEDSLVHPTSLYAYTKLSQEKMFETMCPALDLDYTIFRFQNVYGSGQSLKNPYTGILSVFSTLLLNHKPINIFENGLESRDFIHVKDIASGVIRSLCEDKSNREIINLGSGRDVSVIDIARFLKKIYGSKSQIQVTGDFRIGDIAHNRADIAKARDLLGFEPSISLEEGLRDFCLWVMSEDPAENKYEHSLSEMEKSGLFIKRKG